MLRASAVPDTALPSTRIRRAMQALDIHSIRGMVISLPSPTVPEAVVQALVGHAPDTAAGRSTRGYRDPVPLDAKRKALAPTTHLNRPPEAPADPDQSHRRATVASGRP